MGFAQDRGQRADPLERRFVGKAIVLGVLIVVAIAFVFSAQRADPVHLPGIALDSPFLLDMERAAVAAALVVGAAVFLIRGWAGYFPSKLSTTGAEYLARSSANEAIEHGDELADALANMRSRHLVLIGSLREDIRALEQRMSMLDDGGGVDDA